MAQQTASTVENNFSKGLITENTGLNFPENAATDTDNCEYTLIGNVLRRLGIDFEENFEEQDLGSRINSAVSMYKWKNAGGDGNTQVVVVQVGATLYFYSLSEATQTAPLSTQRLVATVNQADFVASGGTMDTTVENTYSDGNGYLFVFNSCCEPIYCSYNGGAVTASAINIQIRDFVGIPEATPVSARPTSLSAVHKYNLGNQGWTTKSAWGVDSPDTTSINSLGPKTINVGTVAGITLGDTVYGYSNAIYWYPGGPVQYGSGTVVFGGTVTAYSDPFLTINITSCSGFGYPTLFTFIIYQTNEGFIDAWLASQGNYPSNADVWWYFKNASGVFDPATTQPNVSLSAGNAPQGHYIISAFNQDRGSVSGIAGLSPVKTSIRPSNGAWFQGRIWYTGVNTSSPPDTMNPFYSWSENIYFSQVNVGTAVNFGNCHQVNDPTSENLFDLLPTDGGVIQIQGCGRIDKLFPVQNGMLVFAANGVWFITGSQGIGFTASDYTITKLSSIESLSPYSYVDVVGMPYFWNEEGIYTVQPQQGGSLSVESITVTTIDSFYAEIPKQSKKYAKGAYDPIEYRIQWLYKSEEEDDVLDRYSYDRIMNYSTVNKAFYPYSIDNSGTSINSILYVQGPGGSTSPEPGMKYLSSHPSVTSYAYSFAEEFDEDYVDWASVDPVNYDSYFVTGYKIRGQGIRKFQPQYVQVYSNSDTSTGYKIQGLWNYANSGNSGKWTSPQTVINALGRFNVTARRHKIRGSGYVLQYKVTSLQGMPFDIIGWATVDTINQGT